MTIIGRLSSRQPLSLGRFLLFRGWSSPSAGERVLNRLGLREGQAARAASADMLNHTDSQKIKARTAAMLAQRNSGS